ncbi:MAG: transglutaminase domain-containing protein [bacterium]|nr:transglutaminase domain-containing protein [bacterium]
MLKQMLKDKIHRFFSNWYRKKKEKRIIFVTYLSILLCSIYFTIKNPLLLVRIISIDDYKVFNQGPDQQMKIQVKNKVFDYKFPVILNKHELTFLNIDVEKNTSTFVKVINICKSVRNSLKFGDDKVHYYYWEPHLILKDMKRYRFLCDGYARLAASIAQSYGIPSRVLWLKGHVTSEFYISEFDKWVLIDPSFGLYFSSNNIPLSTTEVIHAYENNHPPEISFFNNKTDEEPIPSITKLTSALTNRFTFVFSGENTQKGIRYTILKEKHLPLGLQYKEKEGCNLEICSKITQICLILEFLGLLIFLLI